MLAEEKVVIPEDEKTLIEIKDLKKYFSVSRSFFKSSGQEVKAIDGISFNIREGETIGVVGESGCGKSTLGRNIIRLQKPTSGNIVFDGQDITNLSDGKLKSFRRQMQIVFQDPYASLNPKLKIGEIVGEPLRVNKAGSSAERKDKVESLLERVGLETHYYSKYPHEFSGGQRQRIGIARALTINPKFVVCDEPVSALDVSVQSQVVNLLQDLQEEYQLTYMFISHDLSVVRHISDRVAVMYLGKIVELGDTKDIYENPAHPYTRALLSAIPVPNPREQRQRERIILKGDLPSPINPPKGCRFSTRCPLATDLCREVEPELESKVNKQLVACHYAYEF
ncbi:ABC transporter ATP-binding protein [Ornithinibacillus halotolerans]|uniref:Oligopeptide transport ATP-binding protein AppF n=1 Tax=Ornithinibacillus halotolerans TaxID=1274357 RepID=A0A916WES8_9BACI|nr:dipeptide ABC transporter ATP-binding protein [Ornithinibacillus halotolerans]GGA91185.1 oligopeptide transport ATP-binding protein AppF [Ornithinibacillus halotolerans]